MKELIGDTARARDFWEKELVASVHSGWMHFPAVRQHIIEQIGVGYGWPMDWLLHYLGGRVFDRALSIGCGTGALERDLIQRGICRRIDAFDGAIASLAVAREEGRGLPIRYFAADFNRPALPRGVYDAVFFHQSLHHVAKLERLLRAVMLALKPDGLVYLDEYVGPSRTWWTDARYEHQRALFRELVPQKARLSKELPLPIVYGDPSEAVQSGEIRAQLRVGFDVIDERGYGGNVLSLMCPAVWWEHADEDQLGRLIDAERAELAGGAEPYYMLILARPKQGLSRAVASLRYAVEPKLKRVGRMLR